MRKEARLLKNIPGLALMRGKVYPARRVKQIHIPHADIAFIRRDKTRDCIDHGGFARARAAKKGSDPAGGLEVKIK